jgi:beta-glucan synthesis-associated protein KRE6
MGNLARPGYSATKDGLYVPLFLLLLLAIHIADNCCITFRYNLCDVGTFPNQTLKDKSGPPAALQSNASRPKYNYELSWLSGQRLLYVPSSSSCVLGC